MRELSNIKWTIPAVPMATSMQYVFVCFSECVLVCFSQYMHATLLRARFDERCKYKRGHKHKYFTLFSLVWFSRLHKNNSTTNKAYDVVILIN